MSNFQRPNGHGLRKPLAAPTFGKNLNMTEEQAAETWAKLAKAIEMIHSQNASSLSFEELYRSAYNMVLHRHGQMLYAGMEQSLRSHLDNVLRGLENKAGMAFAREILAKWAAYHKSTGMIRDILMYMDRTFVKHFNRTPVYDRGLQIWSEQVIRDPAVGGALVRLFLSEVARERAGEAVDRPGLAGVTKMLLDLGRDVYVAELERPFLAASRDFFQTEVQRALASADAPDYCAAVEAHILAESERAAAYLDAPVTLPKLLRMLDDVFVRQQIEAVMTTGRRSFVALLDAGDGGLIARCCAVCHRVAEGAPFLRRLLQEHITSAGQSLVADSEASKDAGLFVQRVLDLRAKYAAAIATAFGSDKERSMQALNVAFETFLNSFPRSAEFVSLHLDGQLRKGLATASEDAADAALDAQLQIFRYLHDKDLFERYYKMHLSKRLLCGRIANEAAEQAMLSKLKTECGYQFTSKLEAMFADVRTSADLMAAFRAAHGSGAGGPLGVGGASTSSGGAGGPEVSVQVLTTGSWPQEITTAPCALPQELAAPARAFEAFYHSRHGGRQLKWHTSMGTADMRVTVHGRRLSITVTTHQMAVLMLFNTSSVLTFAQILEATNIPRDELKAALVGLAMHKGKMLLRKAPAQREIADADTFAFNDKFESKLMKIKFIPSSSSKETPVDHIAVRQKVDDDRRSILDATIVRIMKARRVADYNAIVAEVARQTQPRFTPAPADVKKRIEGLIEREYLERDPEDRRLYRYLA